MTAPPAAGSLRRGAMIGAGIAGLVALLVTWWVWGSLNPQPIVSDEQSYVLQSQIFASGHWVAPSPPIPEFFEQAHVLTVPAVASKFPPGHALLMALGALVGWPALMPLLITALTGALLFLLVHRTVNLWAAALACAIWLSDPINLRFRPAYYSEVTTQLMWLISWWALLEWRQTRDRRWLLALAAAVGWGAVTRPLTMLAFAIPVGVIVCRDVARLKKWRDLGLAMALGTAMLGAIPLWSVETIGSWRQTPLDRYRRDYLPYDKPGLGIDTTPPARPLNPVNLRNYAEYYREHVNHTPGNMAGIAFDRLREIARSEWSGPRLVLVPFLLIGLTGVGAELLLAMACSVALFLAYLSYGHFAGWTLYYFEGLPVLSVLTAIGIQRFIGLTVAVRVLMRRLVNTPTRSHVLGMTVAALASLAVLIGFEARAWRADHITNAAWYVKFDQLRAMLPKNPTVIFIHYAPGLRQHPHVVWNSPHLADEPVWIVNDLGDRDRELMRIAGPRIPIAYYEDDGRMVLDRSLLSRP